MNSHALERRPFQRLPLFRPPHTAQKRLNTPFYHMLTSCVFAKIGYKKRLRVAHTQPFLHIGGLSIEKESNYESSYQNDHFALFVLLVPL